MLCTWDESASGSQRPNVGETPNQRQSLGIGLRMNKFFSVFAKNLRFRDGGHFEKLGNDILCYVHGMSQPLDLRDRMSEKPQTSANL